MDLSNQSPIYDTPIQQRTITITDEVLEESHPSASKVQKPRARMGTAALVAIRYLKNPKGSSFADIKKYISSREAVDNATDEKALKMYLTKAVERGILTKQEGKYKIRESAPIRGVAKPKNSKGTGTRSRISRSRKPSPQARARKRTRSSGSQKPSAKAKAKKRTRKSGSRKPSPKSKARKRSRASRSKKTAPKSKARTRTHKSTTRKGTATKRRQPPAKKPDVGQIGEDDDGQSEEDLS